MSSLRMHYVLLNAWRSFMQGGNMGQHTYNCTIYPIHMVGLNKF